MCVLVTQLWPTHCDSMDCGPSRLLCPWDFPGKNTKVGCHFLLQRISLTQGSNSDLLHCRQILYHLSHQESGLTVVHNTTTMCYRYCLESSVDRGTWHGFSFMGHKWAHQHQHMYYCQLVLSYHILMPTHLILTKISHLGRIITLLLPIRECKNPVQGPHLACG